MYHNHSQNTLIMKNTILQVFTQKGHKRIDVIRLLSDKLHYTKQAIRNWLNNDVQPNITVMLKIADIANVHLLELIDLTEYPNHTIENSNAFKRLKDFHSEQLIALNKKFLDMMGQNKAIHA